MDIGPLFKNSVQQVIEKASHRGYTFKSETIDYITGECVSAAQTYGPKFGKYECEISASAMSAAAIKIVEEKGAKIVNVADVKEGWENVLQLGPNCPPHKCLKYSVIDRTEYLRKEMPIFKMLVKGIIKK